MLNFCMKKSIKNLIGKRFGRILVVGFSGRRNRHTFWKTKCDCGNEKEISSCSLVQMGTISCGCYRNEVTSRLKLSHGAARVGKHSSEYGPWMRMRCRTRNKNNPYWHLYGGRGIKTCSGLDSYERFFNTIGLRPSKKHSIDRINNDGHYSCGSCDQCIENGWPMNVRWATTEEQCNNRRSNRRIEIDGRVLTATQWARINGINPLLSLSRMHNGWNPIDAVTISIEESEKNRCKKSAETRKKMLAIKKAKLSSV